MAELQPYYSQWKKFQPVTQAQNGQQLLNAQQFLTPPDQLLDNQPRKVENADSGILNGQFGTFEVDPSYRTPQQRREKPGTSHAIEFRAACVDSLIACLYAL